MKKAQTNAMVIIMMVVIIAMVSISVTWGLIRDQRDTRAITEDPFVVANGTCIRVTNLCIRRGTTSTIENATEASPANRVGNFTECGIGNDLYGYNTHNETDVALIGQTMNSSYTEESCTPIVGITGTIIDYIPILMAVLILVFVSAFAIK